MGTRVQTTVCLLHNNGSRERKRENKNRRRKRSSSRNVYGNRPEINLKNDVTKKSGGSFVGDTGKKGKREGVEQ